MNSRENINKGLVSDLSNYLPLFSYKIQVELFNLFYCIDSSKSFKILKNFIETQNLSNFLRKNKGKVGFFCARALNSLYHRNIHSSSHGFEYLHNVSETRNESISLSINESFHSSRGPFRLKKLWHQEGH